jgi:site-specific DNA recombinase
MDLTELSYGIYARKSNESEDKQVRSIDDQLNTMFDIVKRDEYVIVDGAVFKESKSAKVPDQRPEFNALVKLIESGKINAILTHKSNRLARNPKESGIIQQFLIDGKLRAIVTAEKIYRQNDNAVIFSIDASMDTQYSRDLSKIVKERMRMKAKEGWYPSFAPIGYKNAKENEWSEKNIIAVDEERFPLVRRIWDMVLAGNHTVSQIQRMADKDWGLKSIRRRKSGDHPLTVTAIYYLLEKALYMGAVRYDGVTNPDGLHTPMVTPEEFYRVQEILKRKDAPRPAISDEPDPFPYRGIIKCGECGCSITYSRKTKTQKNGNIHVFEYCYCTRKRRDYDCSQRCKIKPLELTERIRQEICKYSIRDEFFQWACGYLDEFNEEEEAQREQISANQLRTIQSTEKEINELNRMRYKGQVDDGFYDAEKNLLEERLLRFRKKFDEQQDSNKELRKEMERYFNFARYAQEDFASENDVKRNEILSIIGQNLTFKDGELSFEPVKHLIPVLTEYKNLENQYDLVGTLPQQIKKDALVPIIQAWCPE